MYIYISQVTFWHIYALVLIILMSPDTLAVIFKKKYIINGNMMVSLDIDIWINFRLKFSIECICGLLKFYCACAYIRYGLVLAVLMPFDALTAILYGIWNLICHVRPPLFNYCGLHYLYQVFVSPEWEIVIPFPTLSAAACHLKVKVFHGLLKPHFGIYMFLYWLYTGRWHVILTRIIG